MLQTKNVLLPIVLSSMAMVSILVAEALMIEHLPKVAPYLFYFTSASAALLIVYGVPNNIVHTLA